MKTMKTGDLFALAGASMLAGIVVGVYATLYFWGDR